jgi:capsid protein
MKGRIRNGHNSYQDIPATFGKECKEVFSRISPDAYEERRWKAAAGIESVPFEEKKVTDIGY